MKVQNKKNLRTRFLKVERILAHEIAVMKKCNHENLVKLHEVIDDPDKKKMYLIIDFMNLGSLGCKRYMQHHGYDVHSGSIPMNKVYKYFVQCLKGLDYCKSYDLF